MAINNREPNSLLSDDEIDLLEIGSAFRRRWTWVASGGLLGVALAGISLLTPVEKSSKKSIRMVVDVARGPCFSTRAKPTEFANQAAQLIATQISCAGEFDTSRYQLRRLASKKFASNKTFGFIVKPLALAGEGERGPKSATQAVLEVSCNAIDLPIAQAKLVEIKREFSANQIANTQRIAGNLGIKPGKEWITIEDNPVVKQKPKPKSSARTFAFGLLGGLILGSGAALFVERRSDRVFNKSKILGQIGYPLWLTLPLPPWSDQAINPLIGQLAARLDRSVEWRVLSIAHEHEVVQPLAQVLIRQSEPGLKCKSVEPLLNSIIRLGPDALPIGLLVVVESGFNSSQALEDAHLLLKQLNCVQSIGVVLAGVPLPSELIVEQKT